MVDLEFIYLNCAADSVRARLLIFHPGSHFNFGSLIMSIVHLINPLV